MKSQLQLKGDVHTALAQAKRSACGFRTKRRQTCQHLQHVPGQHWLLAQRDEHVKTPALKLYNKRSRAILSPAYKMPH